MMMMQSMISGEWNPKKNGIYNLGTGKARTFDDLVKATFAALDKAWIMALFLTTVAIVFATEYILDAANNINDLFKAFQSLNKEVQTVNADDLEEMEEEQYEEEHPYLHPALLSVKFTFQSSDAEIPPSIERLAAKRVFMDNVIKTINE